jgi:endonuclease/exonuclease/phosphatase family metal-dependent hydrolase
MKLPLALFFCINSLIAFTQTVAMTYNIRNSNAPDGENKWDLRKHKLISLIKKTNPDILGTQEVLFKQWKDLKKNLPEYGVHGAGRNDGKHAGEHSCIFFKKDKYEVSTSGNFWLSETPEVPGSKSWDAAITRICSWVKLRDKKTGKTLFVFNTHFDHKGKTARLESAALVMKMVDSIANKQAVLLIGDFNFTPDADAYKKITDGNFLSDAFDSAQPNYTACGFEVANTRCSRIDYIFYSSHFKKLAYTLHADNDGKYYPSDHLAVSGSFAFSE